MRESLAEIFKRHAGPDGVDVGHADKGTTHSYIGTYEQLLAPFRKKCSFMEIGLAHGWSMRMWGEYFGSECAIVGADISIVFDTIRFDHRFKFIECDATKPEFVSQLGDRRFDIIIDDGSHMEQDQAATFNLLKDRMNPGGIYVIEDILSPEHAIPMLTSLHGNASVHDFRKTKGRFDDVLVVYHF